MMHRRYLRVDVSHRTRGTKLTAVIFLTAFFTVTVAAACAQPVAPSAQPVVSPVVATATTQATMTASPTVPVIATPENPLRTVPITPTANTIGTSPVPTPQPVSAQPLTPTQVNAAPERYLGREITVAGTLQAEGQMPTPRFFLVGDDGARLAVDPWLPIEVMQSPRGGPGPDSMATVTGRRLLVHGTLEQRDTGLALVVSEATEKP
jgi:hypothetical protein